MEFRLIKVELTVKVCGYQSIGRSAMCEHYTIKFELIFKLCRYQSTGRSAMCEHNTTKRKSVEIKNNSGKSSGWKQKILFHLCLVLRAV